jgi:hypothetical protein
MDTLTFLSNLIDSFAWPVFTIVIIIILRTEIRSLLPFIKKIKAGPVEAEFDREVRELRSETETELPGMDSYLPDIKQQNLFQLAQINPRSAIIEAWQGIEFTASKVVEKLGLRQSSKETTLSSSAIRALVKSESLNKSEVALYYDLRSLRNQAVHDENFNPSQEAVLNYIQLSTYLQNRLNQL